MTLFKKYTIEKLLEVGQDQITFYARSIPGKGILSNIFGSDKSDKSNNTQYIMRIQCFFNEALPQVFKLLNKLRSNGDLNNIVNVMDYSIVSIHDDKQLTDMLPTTYLNEYKQLIGTLENENHCQSLLITIEDIPTATLADSVSITQNIVFQLYYSLLALKNVGIDVPKLKLPDIGLVNRTGLNYSICGCVINFDKAYEEKKLSIRDSKSVKSDIRFLNLEYMAISLYPPKKLIDIKHRDIDMSVLDSNKRLDTGSVAVLQFMREKLGARNPPAIEVLNTIARVYYQCSLQVRGKTFTITGSSQTCKAVSNIKKGGGDAGPIFTGINSFDRLREIYNEVRARYKEYADEIGIGKNIDPYLLLKLMIQRDVEHTTVEEELDLEGLKDVYEYMIDRFRVTKQNEVDHEEYVEDVLFEILDRYIHSDYYGADPLDILQDKTQIEVITDKTLDRIEDNRIYKERMEERKSKLPLISRYVSRNIASTIVNFI